MNSQNQISFFGHQIGENCHVSDDDNIDVPFKGFVPSKMILNLL